MFSKRSNETATKQSQKGNSALTVHSPVKGKPANSLTRVNSRVRESPAFEDPFVTSRSYSYNSGTYV